MSRPLELDLSGLMNSTAVITETGIVPQNPVHVTNLTCINAVYGEISYLTLTKTELNLITLRNLNSTIHGYLDSESLRLH